MQYQYYVGKNNALSLVMHYFWNFRYDIFRSFYLRKKYFKWSVTIGNRGLILKLFKIATCLFRNT